MPDDKTIDILVCTNEYWNPDLIKSQLCVIDATGTVRAWVSRTSDPTGDLEIARCVEELLIRSAQPPVPPASEDDLARVAFETSWAGFDTVEKWDNQPEGYKENWRRIVRAVLEANARKGAGDAPR
jgi:hypothetical protein